jgi:L,D-peptidoglycan transpeptidase YkuD (ErfK/YbiS/YcfS/YnhG family)
VRREIGHGRALHEVMKRPDGLYRYGIVVGYNRDPVVKGLGSAIFVHPWKASDRPTSGCVALAEDALVALLSRLDAARQPFILLCGHARYHRPG